MMAKPSLKVRMDVADPGWTSQAPFAWHGIDLALLCERAAGAAWQAGCADRRAENVPAEISLLLADDATLRDLNRRFRGQDKPTNVLSFPVYEPDVLFFGDPVASARGRRAFAESESGYDLLMAGDVAIALETVADEAHIQGKSAKDHLMHLVVHGVLHLMGYDHDDEDAAVHMQSLETAVLISLGGADPYAATVVAT